MLPHYTLNLLELSRTERIPLYVTEIESAHPEKLFHDHLFSELVLVVHGSAKHIVGESTNVIKAGDLLVLHPGVVHGYEKTSDFGIINLAYDHRRLSMPLLDGYELSLFQRFFPSPESTFSEEELCSPAASIPEEQLSGIAESLRQLERELEVDRPGNYYLSLAMFMEIMAHIARMAQVTCETHRQRQRIDTAIEYIYRNMENPIDMELLAKKAGMSYRTLYRSFRNLMGCTPHEFLVQLRLKQATELLRETELNVGEIAQKCGFYDSNHFCRVFRERMKISPRRFRQNSRQAISNTQTNFKAIASF